MKRWPHRHTVSVAFAAAAAIAGIGAVAQAATDTIYKYSTPKTGIFSVSPLAMTPQGPGIDYFADQSTGELRVNTGDGCFTTGVNLPQGATLTGLHTVWTSGGSFSSIFRLFRHSLPTLEPLNIASGVVIGTGPRRIIKGDVTNEFNVINNNLYAYSLLICISDTSDRFHGARVVYTYTQAGD